MWRQNPRNSERIGPYQSALTERHLFRRVPREFFPPRAATDLRPHGTPRDPRLALQPAPDHRSVRAPRADRDQQAHVRNARSPAARRPTSTTAPVRQVTACASVREGPPSPSSSLCKSERDTNDDLPVRGRVAVPGTRRGYRRLVSPSFCPILLGAPRWRFVDPRTPAAARTVPFTYDLAEAHRTGARHPPVVRLSHRVPRMYVVPRATLRTARHVPQLALVARLLWVPWIDHASTTRCTADWNAAISTASSTISSSRDGARNIEPAAAMPAALPVSILASSAATSARSSSWFSTK